MPAVKGVPNKFIYVTGCDSGFGSMVIKELDKLGFGVIAGCYMESSLSKIKSELSANVYPIQVDISKQESVDNAARQIEDIVRSKGGILHGLVNNAGIMVQPGPVEWQDPEAYRRMFNVNVMGSVMTTKSVLPLIRACQGRIVQVASIAGRVALPGQPAYSCTKFAIEGYADVLRQDMYAFGVTVHIIEPGAFNNTRLMDTFYSGLDELWNKIPQKIREDYGEQYYKSLKEDMHMAKEVGGNNNPEIVAHAMVDALTSAAPRYRYKVGWDAKSIYNLLQNCHESTQDGLLTGNFLMKGRRGASAPANAIALATGRYHKNWLKFFITLAAMGYLGYKIKGRAAY